MAIRNTLRRKRKALKIALKHLKAFKRMTIGLVYNEQGLYCSSALLNVWMLIYIGFGDELANLYILSLKYIYFSLY